jgi:two-component system chemotaxis response regulator CheY
MAKILVVDDAAFLRGRVRQVLIGAGHGVIEAENGKDAVAAYRREQPDVVLLDVTMPEMDGIEALGEIRRHDPDARIAMVTAVGQEETIRKALRLGARDFVVKPFRPERILDAIDKLLRE